MWRSSLRCRTVQVGHSGRPGGAYPAAYTPTEIETATPTPSATATATETPIPTQTPTPTQSVTEVQLELRLTGRVPGDQTVPNDSGGAPENTVPENPGSDSGGAGNAGGDFRTRVIKCAARTNRLSARLRMDVVVETE